MAPKWSLFVRRTPLSLKKVVLITDVHPAVPVKGEGFPPNVKITPILIYSVLKRTNEQDFKDIVEWNEHLPELVDEKKFGNAIPLKILHGGLDGVESGLEYLRKGKASAQKIAFKL